MEKNRLSSDTKKSLIQQVDREFVNEVSEELQLLEGGGIEVNFISEIKRKGNNKFTYTYNLTDDIISEITIVEKSRDYITLDIVEGDLRNIVTIYNDGRLFVDGNEAIFNVTESKFNGKDDQRQGSEVVPNETQYYWYTSAPSPTKDIDYTKLIRTHSTSNASLGTKWNLATSSFVSLAIRAVLGLTIAGTITNGIISTIAASMKANAEKLNPTGEYWSYTIPEYQAPAYYTTFTTYIKYSGWYYVYPNHAGTAHHQPMYCIKEWI